MKRRFIWFFSFVLSPVLSFAQSQSSARATASAAPASQARTAAGANSATIRTALSGSGVGGGANVGSFPPGLGQTGQGLTPPVIGANGQPVGSSAISGFGGTTLNSSSALNQQAAGQSGTAVGTMTGGGFQNSVQVPTGQFPVGVGRGEASTGLTPPVIDAEGNVIGGTPNSVGGTTFSSGPGNTVLQQAAGQGSASSGGGFQNFSEATVQSGGFPVGVQRNQFNSSLTPPISAGQSATAQASQAQSNFADSLRTAIAANGATQVLSPVDNSVITVVSQNGVITLLGNVSSPQQRANIEQEVRGLANPSSVNNQLTVNGFAQGTSNAGNFAAGFQETAGQQNSQILEASGAQNNLSLAQLAAQQQQTFNQDLRSAISNPGTTQVFSPQDNSIITVVSQNGTITLRGLVRNANQSQSIERAVQSISNGTVRNELQISQLP